MKNILLIEPNAVLAQLYQRLLAKKDFLTTHVTTAQAGISAADVQAPDIVVLELQLPKHSGIEFLHEFRSYPEWDHIPVIIHTVISPNRLTELTEPLTRELGATKILYKPKTSLQMLLQTIHEQLGV